MRRWSAVLGFVVAFTVAVVAQQVAPYVISQVSAVSGAGASLVALTAPSITLTGAVQALAVTATNSFTLNGSTLCALAVPTISSGFGTSPSVVSNNGSCTFRVNVGTGGAATSGVVAMSVSGVAGWNCQVTDLTNNTVTRETASTTTTTTVTAAAAWAASDILIFNCAAF